MWNDTIKTIKAQLYDRASSPLLSSFLSSCIIWNHRFMATLFSSMPLAEKFAYIDGHYFITYWDYIIWGFVGPMSTGLLMIYLYPIAAKKVYEHWRKKQKELKELQQQIDDKTPLTKEEARQIKREVYEQEIKHQQELEAMTRENARLRETIDTLQKNDLKASVPLTDEAAFEKGSLTGNKVKTEHFIDVLMAGSLIGHDGTGKLGITPRGREYLVLNNLVDDASPINT